jgi:competence protein ComGC
MVSADQQGLPEAQHSRPNVFRRIRLAAHFLRDVGLVLGVPALIALGINLYEVQIKALEQQTHAAEAQVKIAERELDAVKESSSAQLKIATQQFDAINAQIKATESENSLLKETQFDRAVALIENQKKLYEIDRNEIQTQLRKLKADNDNKSIQFDRINKTLKCEHGVLKSYFVMINALTKTVSTNGPPKAWPVANLSEFIDKTCLYTDDDADNTPMK